MHLFRLQQYNGRLTRFGRSVGALAVLLVALVSYLTVSPAAHEFFHRDAGHEDHACVVTAFAAGEGLFVPPVLTVRPATRVVMAVVPAATAPAPAASVGRLPPACGPPALRSIV